MRGIGDVFQTRLNNTWHVADGSGRPRGRRRYFDTSRTRRCGVGHRRAQQRRSSIGRRDARGDRVLDDGLAERGPGHTHVLGGLLAGEPHRGPERARRVSSERPTTVRPGRELHEPRGYDRVRVSHIADVSAASLVPFACKTIAPGSTVNNDGGPTAARSPSTATNTNRPASAPRARQLRPARARSMRRAPRTSPRRPEPWMHACSARSAAPRHAEAASPARPAAFPPSHLDNRRASRRRKRGTARAVAAGSLPGTVCRMNRNACQDARNPPRNIARRSRPRSSGDRATAS